MDVYSHRRLTGEELPLSLPSNPDPTELAYLRGGVQEVIRLAIFRLVQAGRLTLANAKTGMLARTDDPGNTSGMSDMEQTVYNELADPLTVRGICQRLSPYSKNVALLSNSVSTTIGCSRCRP